MTPKEFCEECGAELEAGSKFCEICGAPVTTGVESASTPPVPAAPSQAVPTPPASEPPPLQPQQEQQAKPVSFPPAPQRAPSAPRPAMTASISPPAPPRSVNRVQKTGSSFPWKMIIVISGIGLIVLCGILVAVLGVGWFSFGSILSGSTVTSTPFVIATETKTNASVPITSTPEIATATATSEPTEPAIAETQTGAGDLTGFTDDFSTNANTWKIVSDANNGTAIVENGELNLTVTKPEKYLSVQVPWHTASPLTDVTLSVTATVQTPGLGAFGLFCRASDSKNFYMISIQPKPAGGGQYRFYKDVNGTITHLTEWKDTSLLYGGEVPENVVFSCEGSTQQLEINGQYVDEVSDSDLKSGAVHLFALSLEDVNESNPYRISFDDFEVTTP